MKDLFVLGCLDSSEFHTAREWLGTSDRTQVFETLESMPSDPEASPLAVVVAQTTRGQFSASIGRVLQERYPKAHIFSLVGSWCEGETRSGLPIADAERIYAAEFVSRIKRFCTRPKHAANRLLVNRAKAVVVSHDVWFAESIADAIHVAGGTAVSALTRTRVRLPRANIIVYDVHPSPTQRFDELALIQSQWHLPIICVADFPRGFEVNELLSLGAHSVLPKPFAMDDLLFQINEATNQDQIWVEDETDLSVHEPAA
ncbi:MAG: response regulator transcription factor [Planctomycetales bacterium]|nr:response regulator transcription factor [Planctomycetales bacterium]